MIAQLQKSIEQYRLIVNHTRQLERLLDSGDPLQLQAYVRELRDLQDAAGLHDQDLLTVLDRDLVRWRNHPLLLERQQLLGEIVGANQQLLPKITGMKAVTEAELNQLRGGRAAMSGYAAIGKQSGRVSRSFG